MTDGADGAYDVLLVEDNPGDVRLTEEAFAASDVDDVLHVVRDGDEALDFIYRRDGFEDAPVPDLVLLDLNLPRRDGMEVLAELKDDSTRKRIPVVILTGSEAPEDVVRGYEHHAAAYLTKPVDPEGFVEMVRTLEEFWFSVARLPPVPEER